MTATTAPPGRAQSRTSPPGLPTSQAEATTIILGLSDSLDQMRAYADALYRAGVLEGRRQAAGYCPRHHELIAEATLAGERQAHADDLPAFDAGFAACWQRFGAEIATRSAPPRSPRWRRPVCGNADCRRESCQPRPKRRREPHDPAAMIAKARASWGLT